MSTGSLELRRVCKRYGEVAAVTDISLSVRPGEFLTLLGPSGSGKTTTLVMIAGLARPTSGAILLDGLPLDPLPPYRRELGVVFQNYALFPHMTVAKNVAFPLEMRRVPRTEVTERVAKVLTQVDLPDYGARFPRQLSGGQQQRVALARAMVFRPRILLMDEPLGALDRRTREQMQIEIMHLHRELKMTIVYVTHDQEEALMMSTRIAVFNQGRLEQIGEPTELYERPATRFVASFLGDSNFFLGRVTQSGTEYCRLNGDGFQLRARVDKYLAPGNLAVVAVRPERIRLVRADVASLHRENASQGTLSEVIYLGRSRKYLIHLESGQKLTAIEQGGFESLPATAPGDLVGVTWNARDATTLSEAQDSVSLPTDDSKIDTNLRACVAKEDQAGLDQRG